jgi:CspA family cold shock protein
MPTGTVKWYNREKGFGFILPDEGTHDVFVDKAELDRAKIDNLSEGAKCSYEVGTKPNGRVCAVNLKLL